MRPHEIDRVLLSQKQIQTRVAELGREISLDYADKTPLVIGILNGSFIFIADLVRAFSFHCQVAFIQVSSYYDDTKGSGTVTIKYDPIGNIEGQDILIIEDIIDSGHTLSALLELLRQRNPASIRLCTLLTKPSRREVDIPVDYCGFEIPDEFAVGYGLDYAGLYRNLPFIGVLKFVV